MDEQDIHEAFEVGFEEEQARVNGKRPNVLVCGHTGCGKTSLIQAICEDLVPETAIGSSAPTTTGFDEYANEHIRVWDSKGFEPGKDERDFVGATRRFVRQRQSDPNVDNHVHIVWHAIQAPGARITDCDLTLIREVFPPDHVVVALTKADIARSDQIEAMTRRLTETGINPERIVATSDLRGGALGCTRLVELTHGMLPAAYKASFLEAQRVNREARIGSVHERRGKANAIIAAAVSGAAGIGAAPIPIADATLLIPVQAGMIASLAALHELRREAILHAATPLIARVIGLYSASSLLKLFPGLGSVINAGVAGSLTGALGWYTQGRFEETAIAKIKGTAVPGTVLDFESFKNYFQEYRKRKA